MSKFLPEGKLNNDLLVELLSSINNKNHKTKPKIGEDSAILNVKKYNELLLSSDPITFETKEIGSNLLDVCSNDIYASGGIPKWLLITTLIPVNTTFSSLKKIILELNKSAQEQGIDIIGGHTEVTNSVNKIILSGSIIGVYNKDFKANQKIQENQSIILAGYAGIEASKIILDNSSIKNQRLVKLEKSLKNQSINIKKIANNGTSTKKIIKMHDPTEGGIATALHEICEFGNVSCEIEFEKIIFLPNFLEVCKDLELDPIGVISSGCLLIICKKEDENIIISKYKSIGIPVNLIGKTTNNENNNIININKEKINLKRFDQDEILKIF
tara:strand:+ start:656 stop:1639 length:984 start_codon:yes stop_codon:yes gene_type:complete